ncbi:hypothetical protein BDZ94DRAFT_1319247 [Collybia nuda]|uniref:DUF6533 domain-containing protein n=1 Tax=Collybia nuda TaxID=64659 RepID=A0A9P6CHR9_9AGAR|nr:hypothetical protein BDZ94DRAFT_1319247 [Collybia nuda]
MSMVSAHPDNLVVSTMFGMEFVASVIGSALVFHLWEWILGLSFEVKYIWKKPSSIVKWQYLLSRYLGIVAQIGNTTATYYIHSSYVVPTSFCWMWYGGQLIVSQMLLFSLEISLINRLYALSYSDHRLRTSLYTIVAVEHATVVACSIAAGTTNRVELVGACLPKKALVEIAFIASAVCATQGVIWALTIQHSWKKKVPLTSLVMRDGSWVFGIVFLVIVGGTANAFAPKTRPVFNPFSAFIAALVSSNCRIIINLEGMPQGQRDATTIIEFTSYFSTGEHAVESQHTHS